MRPMRARVSPRDNRAASRQQPGPTRRIAVRYGFEEIPLEMEVGEIVTFTPLLVGLPEDRCQCPHWGYVLGGCIRLRFADGREETSRAGDVFYWPAGHTAWTDEGVTFLEFSPTAEILPVLDHLAKQLGSG
jgi:hypothetical protein